MPLGEALSIGGQLFICQSNPRKTITGLREGERQKLLGDGSNYTTKTKKGMEPRNPGSRGWIEGLLMSGMMNNLKVNAEVILCTVKAQVLSKSPPFSDFDSYLLSEAVPKTQERDDEQDSYDVENNVNVLDDLLTKCYQIGYHMINHWTDSSKASQPSSP
jgi:hypothetical protein